MICEDLRPLEQAILARGFVCSACHDAVMGRYEGTEIFRG